MDTTMILILSGVVCFNFIIMLIKFTLMKNMKKAITDVAIFIAILYICKGSTAMISIGMIASALISVVLFFPVFGKSKKEKEELYINL